MPSIKFAKFMIDVPIKSKKTNIYKFIINESWLKNKKIMTQTVINWMINHKVIGIKNMIKQINFPEKVIVSDCNIFWPLLFSKNLCRRLARYSMVKSSRKCFNKY